jgi:hypothetical protein
MELGLGMNFFQEKLWQTPKSEALIIQTKVCLRGFFDIFATLFEYYARFTQYFF